MSLEDLTPAQRQALSLGAVLLKNPEIHKQAKRLAKAADPTLSIPEIELEDQLAAERERTDKELEKRDKALMEERVARRREERNRQIQAEGLTVEEVEKVIVEENCSYETAIKLVKAMKNTADPSSPLIVSGGHPQHTPIDMRPEQDVRKLSGSALRRWSHDTASQMITDSLRSRASAR